MFIDVNEINALAVERGRKTLRDEILNNPPARFVFMTISGAHLYGFPS